MCCEFCYDPFPIRVVTPSPIYYHSTYHPLRHAPASYHVRSRYPAIFSRAANFLRAPAVNTTFTFRGHVVPGQSRVPCHGVRVPCHAPAVGRPVPRVCRY